MIDLNDRWMFLPGTALDPRTEATLASLAKDDIEGLVDLSGKIVGTVAHTEKALALVQVFSRRSNG